MSYQRLFSLCRIIGYTALISLSLRPLMTADTNRLSPPATLPVTTELNENGSLSLTWESTPEHWYQIETSADLQTWHAVNGTIKASAATTLWTDDGSQTEALPTALTQRFYRVQDLGVFTVTITGNTFTYTDENRTVSGTLLKPATGSGPFPAVVLAHGTGGSAGGIANQYGNTMRDWELVCISATLTHFPPMGTPDATWGHSDENTARIQACLSVLSTLDYVDNNRVAIFGHSRGAFVAIGAGSVLGPRFKAIGVSAGGIVPDTQGTDQSYPTESEASHIVAPTIIFHGSSDTVVQPVTSERLVTLLNTLEVPNARHLFPTTGTSIHNLHFDTEVKAELLVYWNAWLTTHGILP